MPLHPALNKPGILPENYRRLLDSPNKTYRDAVLRRYFEWLCSRDGYMTPEATDKQKYHKAFAQSLRIDLVDRLIDALDRGVCPELPIRLDVAHNLALKLGYKSFGSPQDFLYSFTSERYAKWPTAIVGMGFKSTVMVGSQHAVVTMAARYFDFSLPSRTIDELAGAIASDFWETLEYTSSQPSLRNILDYLLRKYKLPAYANPTTQTTLKDDLNDIQAKLDTVPADAGYADLARKLAEEAIKRIHKKPTLKQQVNEYNKMLADSQPEPPDQKQEQIVLKYVQESNLLQKLLGGRRVDHIQSNVKNQQNPLRKSGCEVDSIYRVLGEKAIVLVEAKAGNAISRSQLYQIYETYRLKLPKDWDVIVVGVLLSTPVNPDDPSVQVVIDMAEIKFDDNALGRVTESIMNMSLGRHYRWLIHRDQPQVI